MKKKNQTESFLAVFSEEISITNERRLKIARFKSNQNQWRWVALLGLLNSLYQINISDVNIDICLDCFQIKNIIEISDSN